MSESPSPAHSLPARTWAWLLGLLLSAGLCVGWAALPTLDAAPLVRMALFAALGINGLFLLFLFPDISPGRATALLFAAAILLRLLLLPAPVSDDIHRYLWEGRLVLAGENPYAMTADDPRRAAYRDADWEKMNHRERLTAYPPGVQWIFAATAALSPHPAIMKLPAMAGDLATLGLLIALLKRRVLPVRWAAGYAFNPIILISYAAEAHFDSLMTAAVLSALLAATLQQSVRVWLWLGVAVQIKIVVLILVPVFLIRRFRSFVWVLLPVLILPSLPFAGHLPNLLAGLTGFAASGVFNAPVASLFLAVFSPAMAARLAGVCFVVVLALILRAQHRGRLDPLTAAGLVLAAFVWCSPIVHFWYAAWLIPFAALRPSFAAAVLSITTAGYFTAWWNDGHGHGWGYGPAITAAIWIPAALAWLLQNRHLPAFRNRPAFAPPASGPPPPARLAIIIPTLHSGRDLPALVRRLDQETGSVVPMVIAEATPSSTGLAPGSLYPAVTVAAARGRGLQIATGIQALPPDCDWILIAHADTIPRPGWYAQLQAAIAAHPDTALFVFGQRFTPAHFRTLIIEVLNELRVLYGGVAFGDQTMVIHRARLRTAGGFPTQPLMEDVEASLRLRPQGPVRYLAWEWQVSAQKWRAPLVPRIAFIVRLLLTYYRARLHGPAAAAETAERLYHEYYPDPENLRQAPAPTGR